MPLSGPRRIRHRAYAYVTSGRSLLVFRHVHFPEAGLQVPAGTIDPGEEPAAAVLREAEEETGLTGLQLVSFIARDERDMSDCGANELQHRWFFHLRYDGEIKESWQHAETSGGKTGPIWFDFFWVDLPAGVPKLIANYDDYVSRLSPITTGA
jgi:8-oxo-dGTP diphosphatase